MYEVQFLATSSADWAVSIELIDDDTNLPLDTTGATFELDVSRGGRTSYLSGSTADGTIEQPEPHIVQWVFPPAQLRTLCDGNAYCVGLTMTTEAGTVQLVIGTLTFIDGIVIP